MGSVPAPVSLSHPDAAHWNRELMLEFQAILEKDPAADLMSMFSEAYLREHQKVLDSQLSYAGLINRRVLSGLQDDLRRDPEANLLSNFPKNYTRRITMALGAKAALKEKQEPEVKAPEFRECHLDRAETATVIYPLSDEVIALLAGCSRPDADQFSLGDEKSLVSSLRTLLWNSPQLWQSSVRGMVVKCNENVIAKVINGNRDYTEYTSMQFLEKRAPQIPAPRPHGLVAFGPFRVIFMSYVPDMTLTQAWPNLSHENKLSIQRQLDDIFRSLRQIRQKEGTSTLGGTCGEGVKELTVDECALFKGITTTKEYSDLQFSARHHGSSTYVGLLRSFLEHDTSTLAHESVFTHGDVRTDNIMVKQDPGSSGQYIVTGIIDWEDSGFYPFYYECTALTRTMSLVDENDWYLFLPQSISPSNFPVRWLVDRLWHIHLRTT
ncbi:phosphotransferase family protein [Aspergillus luchuensis]|nr:phosphotransferase family protein [Aspergillus luchuensis IFO 4308]GAT28451.1 phosphotransferase family protein [Aspergillus luchuensis]